MATFDENEVPLTHEVSPSSQNPHYDRSAFGERQQTLTDLDLMQEWVRLVEVELIPWPRSRSIIIRP